MDLTRDAFVHAAGVSVMLALFVAGALYGVRRMSRPATNPRCAKSLALVCAGWLFPAIGRGMDLGPLGWGVALLLGFPLVALGVIFACLGRVEAANHERAGRGLAHGALALAALFALAGIAGVARGIALRELKAPPGWAMEDWHPGTVVDVSAKGYTFTVPPRPWIRVRAERVNAGADLAFLHEGSGARFVLIARPLEPFARVTDRTLLEASRAELQAFDLGVRLDDAESAPPGLAFGSRAGASAFRHWVHVAAGHAFQLAAWIPEEAARELPGLWAEAFDGFRLIRPKEASSGR